MPPTVVEAKSLGRFYTGNKAESLGGTRETSVEITNSVAVALRRLILTAHPHSTADCFGAPVQVKSSECERMTAKILDELDRLFLQTVIFRSARKSPSSSGCSLVEI